MAGRGGHPRVGRWRPRTVTHKPITNQKKPAKKTGKKKKKEKDLTSDR